MTTGLVGVLVVALVAAVMLVGRNALSTDAGSSDHDAVKQVMTDLQAASRNGDGERICNQIFTPKLSNSVTKSSTGGSCATEVKAKLFSPETKIEVQNIDVADEANATATVKEANGNTSTVFLVKQSGRWRIRGVAPA